jgi:hypothetical protein
MAVSLREDEMPSGPLRLRPPRYDLELSIPRVSDRGSYSRAIAEYDRG